MEMRKRQSEMSLEEKDNEQPRYGQKEIEETCLDGMAAHWQVWDRWEDI